MSVPCTIPRAESGLTVTPAPRKLHDIANHKQHFLNTLHEDPFSIAVDKVVTTTTTTILFCRQSLQHLIREIKNLLEYSNIRSPNMLL